MNVKIKDKQEDLKKGNRQLLSCCAYVAANLGDEGLAASIEKLTTEDIPSDKKQVFKKIVDAARQAGFRAVVAHPGKREWTEAGKNLPAVIESYAGTFHVVTAIDLGPDSYPAAVHLMSIEKQGGRTEEKISFAQARELWSGGLFYFQKINTSLICFSIVANEHKIETTQDRLRHEFNIGEEEIPPDTLVRMSKTLGMKARVLKLGWSEILNLQKAYPVIAKMKNGKHLIVAGSVVSGKDQTRMVGCYDPLLESGGGHLHMDRHEFESIWTGEVYVFKRVYKLSDETQPFSLRWFLPEILKQKTSFIDIGLAVLFINLIALITPIFFQIVIDKVLVNQAFTTLHVLGFGMAVMLLVNGLLDFLRDYLLLHATNKIDLRVTGRTFHHMLQLPLDFFERITAGVLTKHMQQTANIRSFLTGSVFLTMLEATSLFIFLPFLFFYSFKLTSIVLAFTLSIAAIILVLMAPFRRRLNALYDAEGDRQAMLVETISGMPTVKAMAIEPTLRKRWENKVARAVSMQFRVGKISITAKSLTQLLERLMIVALIWVGASQVFNGVLTVGALIAFQMLATRVTSPLVRLVGLIHQYQEASLSVEKLGVVMNARQEWGADRHGTTQSLKGDIVFDKVSFRYGPDLPNVLQDISLVIPFGQTLGIVGPSGSGKTTLTRLLQKVYFPSTGTIRVNNCYLNEIDTAHLRANTGVVLQENFLFRASVADNIRAGQASATREQIIEAAILAGADEFIVKLVQGYDTLLEEGGSNMSGGQRQRLAIARALLTRPDILILDEATSSLDPESERIVRSNLAKIGSGRTVIVVSHRLSMLKNADSIVVLQDGKIVGHGGHEHLLDKCSLYRDLWKEQMEM